MSTKQDKATTERHARTLRELLKRPENKTCADCKRNGMLTLLPRHGWLELIVSAQTRDGPLGTCMAIPQATKRK